MKKQRIASADTGATNKSGNGDGSKLRMVEYIFAQFEYDDSNNMSKVHFDIKPRLEKTGPDENGQNGF
ncbi:MAG: hypothetical protein V3S02_01790 [Dehalococcoidales bacterium]